jgi:mannosyltransferase
LFGGSEWALRLPALPLGLASLYCLWFFARSTLGPSAAIMAMGGLAISPAHIFWSESARGYAGMILFTLISNWFYYKLLYHHSSLDSLPFILSSFIAIYFHLFSAFVVISQMFFVLYIAGSQSSSKNAI